MSLVTLDAPPPPADVHGTPTPARPSVVLHPRDNVGVCLSTAVAGDNREGVTLTVEVPAGHKFALRDIAPGEPVVKFGHPIGVATRDIAAGEFVHSHNVGTALRENLSYEFPASRVASARGVRDIPGGTKSDRESTFGPSDSPEATPIAPHPDGMRLADATFQGFRRPDGRAATRNEIWIVTTVACVNGAAERIAQRANAALPADSPVDGVHTFPHPFGCSQLGDDLASTQAALAGLVNHPNAAAVLVLGLGCENNQLRQQLEAVGPVDPQRVRFFYSQEVPDEIEHGLAVVGELVEYASQFRREPIPASELVLALKCGGSDGYSGITANPLLGRLADRHAARGGTSLLSEIPEMFGAEQVLLSRCGDRETFDALADTVNRFKDYFRAHGQPVSENPSPGNKAGGITTLEEKSLGCVQKGGDAPVREVLDYGRPATPGLGGLSVVNAPGNDGTSCTAMTVAGAHLLLFTTGRGTPMGFPTPTLKISTNSGLAARKPSWIDFDAGRLLAGEEIDTLADDLESLVLATASGEPTRNETNGYREIAVWKTGVTV